MPVKMDNMNWVLFAFWPANQDILAIDSLFDPTSTFHVTMYRNLVHFIQDYQQSKFLLQDRWAWHMRAITVKKQVNDDDCGVCVSLAIYFIIRGLDYHIIPPKKFND
jgi:Ulp1 family protease